MKQPQFGQSSTFSPYNRNINYYNTFQNSSRENFTTRTKNLKLDLGIPYQTHTLKQKLFNKPRPERPYERFIPTKIALTGVDPSGNINEFISNDIIIRFLCKIKCSTTNSIFIVEESIRVYNQITNSISK